jgi:hypothetical protein
MFLMALESFEELVTIVSDVGGEIYFRCVKWQSAASIGKGFSQQQNVQLRMISEKVGETWCVVFVEGAE